MSEARTDGEIVGMILLVFAFAVCVPVGAMLTAWQTAKMSNSQTGDLSEYATPTDVPTYTTPDASK